MLKRCKECKKELEYSFFHVKGKSKTGAIKRDTICKNCKSKVQQRLALLYGDSGTKECSECKKFLLWESFSYRVQDGDRYLRSKCKECSLTAWSKWANANPEYKNKKLESNRRCHQNDKKYHRRGITKQQYLLMLDAQNGLCQICKKPPKNRQDLAIDHNHKTNEVRGLLCKECNRALGLFGDSINAVKNALHYLTERGSYGQE